MASPGDLASAETTRRSLGGDILGALIVVGAIALAFVSYLFIDWLKTRREARRFALKRQRAREAWQQELKDLGHSEPPPPDTKE